MGANGQSWDDRRQDEEFFNLSEMMKKSKFNRGQSKFGYLPLKNRGQMAKKTPSTTFG